MVQPQHTDKHRCVCWPGGCWGCWLRGPGRPVPGAEPQITVPTALWHLGKQALPLQAWQLLGSSHNLWI